MDAAEMLRRGFTRETAIRRDARGTWYDGDVPIDHAPLSRAFDRWIDRAPDGRLCLNNQINWAFVQIEGPPFFVRSVRWAGTEAWLTLSGDTEERLDPTTLRRGPEDGLWCDVREGRVPARFDDHATGRLAERLGEDDAGLYFEIDGSRVRPPVVSDPLIGWDASRGDVEQARTMATTTMGKS